MKVRRWSPGCGHQGKWKYHTRELAEAALEEAMARKRRDKGNAHKKKTGSTRVYTCPDCEGFHLTSGKSTKAKAGRKKR